MSDLTLDKDVSLQTLGLWKKCIGKVLGGLEVLHKQTVPVLTLLFGLCLLVIYFHISQLKTQMVATIALRGADTHSRESSDMREWYSIEVVQRLHALGLKDSEPYREKEGAIPLPALLSLNLGGQLFSGRPGERVRLLSGYPFPQAGDPGQLMDSYQRKAWEFLNQHPEESFYRVEQVMVVNHCVLPRPAVCSRNV